MTKIKHQPAQGQQYAIQRITTERMQLYSVIEELIRTMHHFNRDGTQRYYLDGVKKILSILEKMRNSKSIEIFEINNATANLGFVHSVEYIEALKTGQPLSLATSSGHLWNKNAFEVAQNYAETVYHAMLAAIQKGAALSLSSGGHHAIAERGFGFNAVNSLAVAIRMLREAGNQIDVTILDIDAHLANGTKQILANEPGVTIYDIWLHTIPGWQDPQAENIYSYRPNSIEEYKKNFLDVLEQIKLRNPGLLAIQSGIDVLQTDRLGGLTGFTKEILLWREQTLVKFCIENKIPFVYLTGGGYAHNDERREESLNYIIETYCEIFELIAKLFLDT